MSPARPVEVRFLAFPVARRRAVSDYYSSLLRELTLIAAADPVHRHGAPLRLRALMEDERYRHREVGSVLERQIRAAEAEGRDHVDLVISVTTDAGRYALRLAHLLREVDRSARRGVLLTAPTPAPVAEVRDWFLHEVVEQTAGTEPLPWPAWDGVATRGEMVTAASEQARLAFDVGRIGFWQWTPVTGRLRLGAALEALMGLAPGRAPETSEGYLQLVHPEDRPAVEAAVGEAFSTGGELRFEHRVVRPDGEVIWIEARGAGLADETGAIVGWAGVGIDTTASKKQSLARTHLLAEAVKARKQAERVNAALRGVVDRLDTLVQQEHHIAQTLQRAMFTEDLPVLPGLEVAARYLPGAAELTVGGDWYDVVVTPDGPLLVIGDVAGHGLRAAAVMARIRHAVHFAAAEHTDPGDVLSRLNDFIARSPGDDLATVHVLRVDEAAGVLRYASAGHPPPVLRPASGDTGLLRAGLGPPLGAVAGFPFPEAVQPYSPGDRLVLYTDGLIERRGEVLDRSLERLCLAVSEAPEPVEALIAAVLDRLLDEDPCDDVAVLAVRF